MTRPPPSAASLVPRQRFLHDRPEEWQVQADRRPIVHEFRMVFSWIGFPLGGGQDGVVPDRVIMMSYGRADTLVVAQERCGVEKL